MITNMAGFRFVLWTKVALALEGLRVLTEMLSGSNILLAIIEELSMILQNIVGDVLINISLSNLFLTMLLPTRFDRNCQATFGRCQN